MQGFYLNVKKKFRSFYQKHALQCRFLVIGGFNTLIGIFVYPLLYWWLVPASHAVNIMVVDSVLVVSQIICISNSYLMNKYFVFKTKGLSFWEYLRFTLFYNIIFIINLGLLPLLIKIMHANPAKIQIGINVLVAMSSYFWHKLVTFKKKTI